MAYEGLVGRPRRAIAIIDYALAEKSEPYPDGQAKPHERVMIETALIRFRGDKAKTARFIGWSRTKLYQ